MTPAILILRSFFSPKSVLGYVVKIDVNWRTLIEATLFVSVLNTLLTHLFNIVTYSANRNEETLLGPYIDLVLNRPFLLSIIEFGKIFFITTLLTYGGKLFSGSGSFFNALKVVVWVHFVLIFINLGLFIAIQLNIALAGYLIILTNFWIMWVLSECAVKIHNFRSTFMVFAVGFILFILVIAILIQIMDSLGFGFLERAGFGA
ncbi:MAG: YIP1 family protein [Paracoccaceae bacterium]|nr:YIP1 family protein [Paracoccaceae bacterium]